MQELDNAQSRLGEQALLLKRAVCRLSASLINSPPPTGSTRIGDPPLVRHGCHRTRCDGAWPITSRRATNSLRAPDTRPSPQKSFYRQTDICVVHRSMTTVLSSGSLFSRGVKSKKSPHRAWHGILHIGG
ncbi:hypothetical protein NW759_002270 [Fusarium solani]|nr:hypothetical protein NW759_002270 [Fusarium solani]